MKFTRRQFLGATSSAAAIGALAEPAAAHAQPGQPLTTRADFPAANEVAYLNTAYIGPIARPVVEAGRAWLEARARRPYEVGEMFAKADEVRHRFASLINATDDEIGLLFATSEGENVVVDALDFKAGDNVVIDDLVLPSTPVIHRRLQETKGVELRIVKHRGGAVHVSDYEKLVDNRTRLVSVAWVSNINGFRHDMRPLADLAHAHGAYLYTDAIQAIGTAPLDVRAAGVDFLCCGIYKWLMAGFGVAPFYVRRELLDRIGADRVGWHVEKRLDDYRYQHFRTGKKLTSSASLSFGEIYQLAAALAYLERVGLAAIETHTSGARRAAAQGARRSQVHDLHTGRKSIADRQLLHRSGGGRRDARRSRPAGVKVTVQNGDRTDAYGGSGAPVSRVRVAVSFFNNAADIQRMLDASERLRRS